MLTLAFPAPKKFPMCIRNNSQPVNRAINSSPSLAKLRFFLTNVFSNSPIVNFARVFLLILQAYFTLKKKINNIVLGLVLFPKFQSELKTNSEGLVMGEG